MGSCLRRRSLRRHCPRPPAAREDRIRPIGATPADPRLGRRLQVRAMSRMRPLLVPVGLALVGASGAIATGALSGMPPKELGHLAIFLFGGVAAGLVAMSARLLRAMERERTAERQRRDLVIAVSHDLRTPLAGLRAMTEAIEDGIVRDPQTLERYLSDMRRSVGSLVELVDDLFEFVQLDAGELEAECERARVDQVVGAAVAACDLLATEKGLKLETRLPGAAGASRSPRPTPG